MWKINILLFGANDDYVSLTVYAGANSEGGILDATGVLPLTFDLQSKSSEYIKACVYPTCVLFFIKRSIKKTLKIIVDNGSIYRVSL